MKTVYVTDDSSTYLLKISGILKEYYNIRAFSSAGEMFESLEMNGAPDLILLDIEMPVMNGHEALRRLKSNTAYRDIPVIFLTGSDYDDSVEARGFELGAVDFIRKPSSTPVLLNRIKTHLEIDQIIHERTRQVQQLQNNILSVIADMIEGKDKITGGHIEQTAGYVRILIEEMLKRGVYADEIAKWNIEMTISASRLHDTGKITISDAILNKPGKLSPEEFNIMKTHTTAGERIIDKIIDRTPQGEEIFLRYAKIFAGYHHERWDGNGYPYGLAGEDIPLQGRILAIADVYDTLVSARVYKKAFSDETAASIILAESGKHFDPAIVEVFNQVKERFKERP